MLFALNNLRHNQNFIENFIEYIYIFIYMYIYLIFLSFPVKISILYCFPFSLLFFTCVCLLSRNIPVFHLKSFRFDLCQQPKCWENERVTYAAFKMAFPSGYELKMKGQNVHVHTTLQKVKCKFRMRVGVHLVILSQFTYFPEARG